MAYQIMVVEDNHNLQEIYVRTLQKLDGCEVVAFGDGREALAYLESSPPDLMTLDINLPGVSGVDILKHARLRLNLDDLKIVVATANIIAVRQQVMTLADICLEKPVKARDLREICRDLLAIDQPITG